MRLLISAFLLLPVLAAAETAYVTDNLRLGLHAAEDTSDRAFRFLESGQPMEILVRDRNYANVRLPDGTEGWVKSAYLVDEKPAKLIVAETIAEAKEAFAEPAATIDQLRAETTDLTTQLDDAQAEITSLRDEVASIEGMKEEYRGAVPLKWVGGVIVVCLVLGFLLALWWSDRQNRKRHGGIRIY